MIDLKMMLAAMANAISVVLDYIGGHSGQILALIALAVSIYTMWIQRRHNFKSLQPLPFISFMDQENRIAVALTNVGVGPFIIDKLAVRNSRTGEEKGNVFHFMPPLPDGILWSMFVCNDIEERPIAVDDPLVLVEFIAEPMNSLRISEVRDAIRVALSELTMSVDGRDIYGRKMKRCTRDFKWFARRLSGKISE
ncbi:MAG TPA: hypothetical protein VIJ62_06695 [Rhizomicrobium sp.]